MASSQPLDRTSSSFPGFFLGIVIYLLENGAPCCEYGNKLEWMPSLDLLIGAGSVRTGAAWFVFNSIGSRLVIKYYLQITIAVQGLVWKKLCQKHRLRSKTEIFYPTLLSMKNHLFNVFLSQLVGEQSIKHRLPQNCRWHYSVKWEDKIYSFRTSVCEKQNKCSN